MAKRKISAKEAVAAIRSGMDDAALMKEFGLAPGGLQSLFDKLVTGGYLDLAEIQARMPGFMGTVNIDDPFFPAKGGATESVLQPQAGRSGAWINAQEAARDIRAGLDDASLMEKYRLTSRGLRSMADKLISVGLITQADLDLRRVGLQENTVVLSEEMLELFAELKQSERAAPEKAVKLGAPKRDQIRKDAETMTSLDKNAERPQQVEQTPPMIASRSHDDAPKHSAKSKAMIIAACISLVIVSLVLAWELLAWL